MLGLRRNPDRLPTQFDGQAVDLHRTQPRLPADTNLVVVALTADTVTAQSYRDTYITGLGHLLDAIDQDLAVPPRVLFVSSTAVYGVTDGSWVDERSPARPATATGEQLRAAERLLHSRLPESIVLRLAGLYGPKPGRLVAGVRNGTATIPATPVFTNRIHRDDAARAIVHLGTCFPAPEPVYLGVDHEPVERATVLRFVAEQLGVSPPPLAADGSSRGRGKRCSGERLRQTGYRFIYPTYRDGYGAALEGSH